VGREAVGAGSDARYNVRVMTESWDWIAHSDAGLWARIAVGVAIFATLAIVDFHRQGRAATRWREYLFLLAAVVVALLYGVVNDQLTSRISWEYYYYGKGLEQALGDRTPPDAGRLHWEAVKVGLKATWSVGLLIGVACLLANNPRPDRRRLSNAQLLARMPLVSLSAATCALVLGYVGYRGGLAAVSDDFAYMVRRNEFRPYRFMAVYGIHLGGYVGGLAGTGLAVISILHARRRR